MKMPVALLAGFSFVFSPALSVPADVSPFFCAASTGRISADMVYDFLIT